MYGVILEGWDSAEGVHACAEQPFTELRQAEQLMEFDSVEIISGAEYDLVPQPTPPRSLLHSPDSRHFQGVVRRLVAKPEALKTFIRPE
jgi:hypothetical protein